VGIQAMQAQLLIYMNTLLQNLSYTNPNGGGNVALLMRIEYKCPYDVSPSNKTELLKLSTFFNV
jgi:hypothetical protein